MNQYILILKIFFKKNYFFDNESSKKIKLSFLLFLIISFLEFLSIGLLILVILSAIGHKSNFSNYLSFFSFLENQHLLIFFIIFIIFKYIIQITFTYLEKTILKNLQIDYNSKLLNAYFNASFTKFTKLDHSVILNNLNNQVRNVFVSFFRPANEFFSELIIIFFLLFLLSIFIDTKLFFIFIIVSIFFVYFLKWISKVANYWGKKRVEAGTEFFSNLNGILKNFYIIKLLNKELFFLNKIKPIFSTIVKAEYIEDIGQKIFRIFLEAFVFTFFLVILVFLNSESQDDLIIKMIQIFLPFLRLLPSFMKVNTSLNKMLYALPSVKDLQETSENLKKSVFKNECNLKILNFYKEIEIKNLQFSYDDKKNIINKNLIKFSKNQKYLIQGRSGSGKTTFIELLLGFKKADSGQFLVDAKLCNPIIEKNWKKLFGYVPQEVSLLNETIASNIAFGEEKKTINYDKIKKILKIMNLDNKLSPDYVIENFGSNISGGQKQRVGICRSLYFDPEILVFDEPTSALNAEDSKKIMIDILDLNKTIIVVSHDLNITPFFKNIINFD